MEKLIGFLLLFLYIFLAYRFFINSLKTLVKYFQTEGLPYEIIPGTIVDFEQRRVSRPRSSRKRIVFYPVFEYQWKGKTRRKFARWVGARLGPGLTVIPATDLQLGDAVQVRIFPKKPGEARIEEAHHFWKSRMWGHVLCVIGCAAMMIYGMYAAIGQLLS